MSEFFDDYSGTDLGASTEPKGQQDTPRSSSAGGSAPQKPLVWQSLTEFKGKLGESASTDEGGTGDVSAFIGREFPSDDFDQLNGIDEVDRRRFMQILGASAALAGASSCRWERENILPHTNRPEDTVPGKPKHYASVMDLAGAARPLTVTSFDGRPVKVEPNTKVGAGTDVFSQGEILGFYDPDRTRVVQTKVDGELRRPRTKDKAEMSATEAWAHAGTALAGAVAAGGVTVLASTSSSPTLARLGAELSAAPGVNWVWWSPTDRDNVVAGSLLAFRRPVRSRFNLGVADVVIDLDCDFQRAHPDAVRLSGDFAKRRMPEQGAMSRLYSVESRFTSTGVTADHRLPVRSVDAGAVLELLDQKLGGNAALSSRASELKANAKVEAFVDHAAKDILASGGRFAIIAGASQAPEVHARVHAIHAAQGAHGGAVELIDEPLSAASGEALTKVVADMNSGAVKTLLILGGNPVYDAPQDLGFAAALAKVENTAHLSLYRDETTMACGWSLPMAHWLECWGDAQSFDGHQHIAQPLIKPLHRGKSAIEICSILLGREGDGRTEVRATHAALDETAYRKAIHDGLIEGSKPAHQSLNVTGPAAAIPAAESGTEITFFPCPKIFDGRFANNGWLQELPDFTTKMTWDNALLVGTATAEKLGVTTGDFLDVKIQGRALKVAAYVAPGQAEDSVSISLGYGREHAGLVAGSAKAKVDSAGFNAYALRGTSGMYAATGVAVTKASGSYDFATTQEHHLIDEIGMQGRRERLHKLVMETDAKTYEEHPDHFKHVYHVPKRASLYDQKVYQGQHQWGMTIDLSTCNGCNACVIACQSENNIPIVGKKQVMRGREMHWMRVDLYYQGDADDATTVDAVNQPINCLQCENAPCEQVCPVAATVHGEEGTNDMVYNRCIGTRYCGNNCPVKVRRFNYFHYTKYMDKPEHKLLQLAQNPNVTVRSRGVMEKCTYCTQRISEARIVARNEGRKIRDGEVITACQASCPTQAITFGDISDQTSKVSEKMRLNRDYAMLEELGVRPRTQYLARISNPNADLASAMPQGMKGRADWHGDDGHGHGHEEVAAEAGGEVKAGHDDHGHGAHAKPERPGPWDYTADAHDGDSHSHDDGAPHSHGGGDH